MDLQNRTNMHVYEILVLWEDYDLGYQTSYAWRDDLQGWDVYKILEEIKNMDYPIPHYLLDEISDLKIEQEEDFDLPHDALGGSLTTSKAKETTKEDQLF